MAQVTSGLVGGAKLTQLEVNYRHHEKCGTCTHFYPGNSCDIVEGNISPEAVCIKYEITAPPRVRDGDFFRDEFEKVNKNELS